MYSGNKFSGATTKSEIQCVIHFPKWNEYNIRWAHWDQKKFAGIFVLWPIINSNLIAVFKGDFPI